MKRATFEVHTRSRISRASEKEKNVCAAVKEREIVERKRLVRRRENEFNRKAKKEKTENKPYDSKKRSREAKKTYSIANNTMLNVCLVSDDYRAPTIRLQYT